MALLIKQGEIVTDTEQYQADIFCEGETITRIGPDLEVPPGTEVVEAAGKLVFPGFIDPHVHIYLPCLGTQAKDTHETASRAALIGGTTTLIEMLGPDRAQAPLEGFEVWMDKARGHCACDFSFHMTVSRCDPEAQRQLAEIVRRGVSSFKIYLAYKGTFALDDEELFQALTLARRLGVTTTAHCENAGLVEQMQRQLLAEGRTGPEWHYASRPPLVEAEGVHRLLTFAQVAEAPVYIVHLSCGEALAEVLAARRRGANVRIETLIQYLLLDKTFAERPNFEGAKYVMSPPLRDRESQLALWAAVKDGVIDTVATDHAPFDFATQKRMGERDFTKIPSGLPGIENRVGLLYSFGVRRGRLNLQRFVAVASTQPAKIFGLFPRKGCIRPGSDADLVVYDPAYRGVISARTHSMTVDYNPYEGFAIEGRPSIVTVRGAVMVRDGAFVGDAARGRFLPREASFRPQARRADLA